MENEIGWIEKLVSASPAVLLVVVLNMVGYFLKKSPISNWCIPWVLLVAGTVIYPFIGDLAQVHAGVRSPLVYQAVVGAAIGLVSVGVHQAVQNIWNREKHDDGGTKFIKKD